MAIGPKTVAAAGVVVGVATGAVTNLVTNAWSWTLGAALAVLVAVGVYLAVRVTANPPQRTRIRTVAGRGARITRANVTASGGADARQTAGPDSEITDSPITARGADADVRTRRGARITDTRYNADP
ncbi:hypothetical protein [Embleya sp. NPDC001921]